MIIVIGVSSVSYLLQFAVAELLSLYSYVVFFCLILVGAGIPSRRSAQSKYQLCSLES